MNRHFTCFTVDDPAYAEARALREKILRTPLGLTLTAKETAADAEYVHAGAFEDGRLIGCVVAVPLAMDSWKLRQVAVEESHQGQGVGSALTRFIEAELQQHGAKRITLNARATAIMFYTKLGYASVGEEFIESTIPHVRMEKDM